MIETLMGLKLSFAAIGEPESTTSWSIRWNDSPHASQPWANLVSFRPVQELRRSAICLCCQRSLACTRWQPARHAEARAHVSFALGRARRLWDSSPFTNRNARPSQRPWLRYTKRGSHGASQPRCRGRGNAWALSATAIPDAFASGL